jgi:predicted DNA-binding ribbon-helix-helix protein
MSTDDNDPSEIRKRSVSIAGHATSISLEDAFWRRLNAIAKARGTSLSGLIRDVDEARTGNLSSALRVFVLENCSKD